MNPPTSAAPGVEAGNPNAETQSPPALGVDHARAGSDERATRHYWLPDHARSNRGAVRNPIAADEEIARQILFLTRSERAALSRFLRRLSTKWRDQAAQSWKKHKAPMAAYHKANAVNARHLALALDAANRRDHERVTPC